ncbi:hypothetical protein BBBOND_0208130 [Babesia bigemina]|uniref:Uncharacterized protein n=1 Tax=Babesia bigemina TaxID=5866 RepID=A0A061D9R4_BABBI|nr:hypothetical protein BBBOND_0208130 [Babesia bigemina]CDR95659.1 hypothetical protein BBBOND_0208130 [Babesia bigemina]|eukprot:XP_012767845.1 hypothetical protein BBBOND_0208130 [Babesia bigemina]
MSDTDTSDKIQHSRRLCDTLPRCQNRLGGNIRLLKIIPLQHESQYLPKYDVQNGYIHTSIITSVCIVVRKMTLIRIREHTVLSAYRITMMRKRQRIEKARSPTHYLGTKGSNGSVQKGNKRK